MSFPLFYLIRNVKKSSFLQEKHSGMSPIEIVVAQDRAVLDAYPGYSFYASHPVKVVAVEVISRMQRRFFGRACSFQEMQPIIKKVAGKYYDSKAQSERFVYETYIKYVARCSDQEPISVKGCRTTGLILDGELMVTKLNRVWQIKDIGIVWQPCRWCGDKVFELDVPAWRFKSSYYRESLHCKKWQCKAINHYLSVPRYRGGCKPTNKQLAATGRKFYEEIAISNFLNNTLREIKNGKDARSQKRGQNNSRTSGCAV